MEGNLTEFEESLSFDVDDPDFAPISSCGLIATLKTHETTLRGHHITGKLTIQINYKILAILVNLLTRLLTVPKSYRVEGLI